MSSYHSALNALAQLPEPGEAQKAHSLRLIEQLERQMPMSFHDYMQQVLYTPGLGYYVAGAQRFGAAGDFITAPEISPLFGRTLARFCQQHMATSGAAILEIGAGSGRMARDILQQYADAGLDPIDYWILEPSAALQQQQQALLKTLGEPQFRRIHWLTAWPEHFSGVVLGNEVLDAMPVNVVVKQQQQWWELGVATQEQGFAWVQIGDQHNPACMAMREIEAQLPETLPEGYCTEINRYYPGWFSELYAALDQATVVLIDYGYSQHEYYRPERSSGTLMCYYRHRAHADPLVLPGLQDITSFVDFDAAAAAASAAGFESIERTSQAEFLMHNGLLDWPQADDPTALLQQAQQIKQLTLPGEMGEKFQVLTLSKNP